MIPSSLCRKTRKFMVTICTLGPFDTMLKFGFSGFTVSLYEYEATIPSLWKTTKGRFHHVSTSTVRYWRLILEFIEKYPEYLPKDNAMDFISANNGDTYNRCHCMCPFDIQIIPFLINHFIVWSNFEIGDLNFWRGEAYTKYFEFLDQAGGFYYEVRIFVLLFIEYLSYSITALGWCSCA